MKTLSVTFTLVVFTITQVMTVSSVSLNDDDFPWNSIINADVESLRNLNAAESNKLTSLPVFSDDFRSEVNTFLEEQQFLKLLKVLSDVTINADDDGADDDDDIPELFQEEKRQTPFSSGPSFLESLLRIGNMPRSKEGNSIETRSREHSRGFHSWGG